MAQQMTNANLKMAPKRHLSLSKAILFLLLLFLSVISIVPLYWMFRSSLMSNAEIFVFPPKIFPSTWRWSNYQGNGGGGRPEGAIRWGGERIRGLHGGRDLHRAPGYLGPYWGITRQRNMAKHIKNELAVRAGACCLKQCRQNDGSFVGIMGGRSYGFRNGTQMPSDL